MRDDAPGRALGRALKAAPVTLASSSLAHKLKAAPVLGGGVFCWGPGHLLFHSKNQRGLDPAGGHSGRRGSDGGTVTWECPGLVGCLERGELEGKERTGPLSDSVSDDMVSRSQALEPDRPHSNPGSVASPGGRVHSNVSLVLICKMRTVCPTHGCLQLGVNI